MSKAVFYLFEDLHPHLHSQLFQRQLSVHQLLLCPQLFSLRSEPIGLGPSARAVLSCILASAREPHAGVLPLANEAVEVAANLFVVLQTNRSPLLDERVQKVLVLALAFELLAWPR